MSSKNPITILFLILCLNYSCNGKIEKIENEMCFTKKNFDTVCKFIKTQTIKNQSDFYTYDDIEIYISSIDELSFKKNGSTLAIINKEKGIFSLAMNKDQNDKLVSKANQLFCKLLSEVFN